MWVRSTPGVADSALHEVTLRRALGDFWRPLPGAAAAPAAPIGDNWPDDGWPHDEAR